MSDVPRLERELNQMIREGKILDAFEAFYADDVRMQENAGEPFEGKEACRKHEQEFLDSVETFHGATLVGSAAGDEKGYSEWIFNVTFKGRGRVKMEQVAARSWRDGKVVHERFYYDSGS